MTYKCNIFFLSTVERSSFKPCSIQRSHLSNPSMSHRGQQKCGTLENFLARSYLNRAGKSIGTWERRNFLVSNFHRKLQDPKNMSKFEITGEEMEQGRLGGKLSCYYLRAGSGVARGSFSELHSSDWRKHPHLSKTDIYLFYHGSIFLRVLIITPYRNS